ncbi:MAG: formate dehydrogenase accessory sulfurtransferase FdhD [Proteobacteria bacterium]|nr:FdhD/NarQ family protein [alpha proteobacterium HIMB5]REK44393.1 MAG: formate dehydrogenase accessory sulfurtransferase FdhD [Pseudomonadota bacterium]
MNSKYKISKYKNNKLDNVEDYISIEEPLEINLKYKDGKDWKKENLSITMRTPGDDENLSVGFLYNEQIITDINWIEKIESYGENNGQYDFKNKILITLNNSDNVNISQVKRNFLMNSSCGVCGKTSLDALETLKKDKPKYPNKKINKNIIIKSPEILKENQTQFSITGGIHASGLFSNDGNLIAVKEDVGRHNALDKLIGETLQKKLLKENDQFITCSGRLNFELVQKALINNIGLMIGVGAPTSLAIDLANRFDMTLVGFVKQDSFNIYSNSQRVEIN